MGWMPRAEWVFSWAILACNVDSRPVEVFMAPNAAVGGDTTAPDTMRTPDAGVSAGPPNTPTGGMLTSTVQTLEFEPREVGTVSDSLSWVIDNSSDHETGELTLSNSSPDEFQVTRACPATLGARASCTIGLRFVPQ